jgi:hypothetical protein
MLAVLYRRWQSGWRSIQFIHPGTNAFWATAAAFFRGGARLMPFRHD